MDKKAPFSPTDRVCWKAEPRGETFIVRKVYFSEEKGCWYVELEGRAKPHNAEHLQRA